MKEDITDIYDNIPARCPGCGKPMRKNVTTVKRDGKEFKFMIAQRVFVNVAHDPPIKRVVCKRNCKYKLAEKLREEFKIDGI